GGAAPSRDQDETEGGEDDGEEEGGQEEEVVWVPGSGDKASPDPVERSAGRRGRLAPPAAGLQTALTTLPPRRQRVQTRTRLARPFTTARIDTRFGSHRRAETLCAWLIWLPTTGPFPHTSQRWAMLLDFSGEMARAVSGPGTGRLAAEQRNSIPWGPR